MTKNQTLARDFTQLAMIHARDGEAVSRSIIDALKPEARDELYALAHALTGALKAGPRTVDTGIRSPSGSPLAVAGEAEHTDDPSPMARTVAAADAIPGLARINRG